MRIHITIEKPGKITDSYGRLIKGPIKPLGAFETFDGAIEWLENLKKRQSSGDKAQ